MAGPVLYNTPSRIIYFALRNALLIQPGDDPDGEDLMEYFQRLQDLVNLWQTDGLRLWLNSDVTVPLVAGTATYFFGSGISKPLRVIQGYYQDSNGVRRPLQVLSRDEYVRLSQVSQQGQINSYFVDKQQNTLNVYFWLTPDTTAATGTAHLIQQLAESTLTELDDNMNFPQEWFMALHWGLAAEICNGQPPAVQQRCVQNAMRYKDALDNWDVEDASTRFVPDPQMQYVGGRFNAR